MKKYLIIAISFLIAFSSYGQNAKEDFIKINEAYSKYKDMSMNIIYNLYANYSASTPSETETGFFKQQGELRYSKLKDVETVQNEKYMVVVDNDEKIIVVANPAKFSVKAVTMLDLDQAFSLCSTVKFLNGNAKTNGYKFTFKTNIVSEFDAIDLYYDKNNFLIEKIIFYYREKMRINEEDETLPEEKPKLEIVFTKLNFKPTIEKNFFSEQRFIAKNRGKYVAVNNYKEYEVINQKFEK